EHGPIQMARGADGKFMGPVSSWELSASGKLWFSDGQKEVLIQVFPGSIVNFQFFPKGMGSHMESEAVVLEPQSIQKRQLREVADKLILTLDKGNRLEIHKQNFKLRYWQQDQVIFEEENGFFLDEREQLVGPVVGCRIQLKPEEKLFGGGARAIGLNRRGNRLYHENRAPLGYARGEQELSLSIPFFLSSQSYGLLFDNYRAGYADLGKTEKQVLEFGANDSLFSYFLIPGDHPREIISSYTALTGRQPLPPRWSLGYMQSSQAGRDQASMEKMVAATLKLGFPLDAVTINEGWFGGKSKNGFLTWDQQRYPNPQALINKMRRWGIKSLLHTEPYFVQGTPFFEELEQKSLFTRSEGGSSFILPDFVGGPAALLDIFHQQAGDWFWPFYKRQINRGIAGFMCEESGAIYHPKQMFHVNGNAQAVHNLYAFAWARILDQKFRQTVSDRRPFYLVTSGYAGMQRFSTFPWSGATIPDWNTLRALPGLLLGGSVSGLGYMHSEIGAALGTRTDEELYLRWLQLGAFSPVMRAHSRHAGPEPEAFYLEKGVQKAAKDIIQLRYKFLPYNYHLAFENTQKGYPLVRPLFFHYPADGAAWESHDQWLWGEEVLFAPILKARMHTRSVYLPKGHWVDYWSEKVYQGGQTHDMTSTLTKAPIWVRSGSFLLLTSQQLRHTDHYHGDSLEIHYYTDPELKPSEKSFWGDDGNNPQSIAEEATYQHHFFALPQKKRLHLSWKTEGQAKDASESRVWFFVIHQVPEKPKTIKVGTKEVYLSANRNSLRFPGPDVAYYDDQKRILKIRISQEESEGNLEVLGKISL
ncbi:MAG: TIM-barrel domain-containing protein, partial [Bacteroidota bacterium]